jgi:hypothetical protein
VVCGLCHINCLKVGNIDPPASERPIGRGPQIGLLPAKKDAGPKGPASQTGRLHVWETWDHEDPEFRTRKALTIRVENLS